MWMTFALNLSSLGWEAGLLLEFLLFNHPLHLCFSVFLSDLVPFTLCFVAAEPPTPWLAPHLCDFHQGSPWTILAEKCFLRDRSHESKYTHPVSSSSLGLLACEITWLWLPYMLQHFSFDYHGFAIYRTLAPLDRSRGSKLKWCAGHFFRIYKVRRL